MVNRVGLSSRNCRIPNLQAPFASGPIALADEHQALASLFGLESPVISTSNFGNGLINDTYLVETAPNDDFSNHRYILQRINHGVFKNPHALMANIERVCAHLAGIEEDREQSARVLELLPSVDGPSFVHYPTSLTEPIGYWRMFHYVEDCVSHDTVATPEIAYEAARAFGRFQRQLDGMPGPRLYETIPGFHETPSRLASLHAAIQEDPFDRARLCKEEIRFAIDRGHHASRLLDLHREGFIPERITHNDTKISNVLIDRRSGRSVCVVDLDTVMPGLSLYDFGDLVRTCVSSGPEDSTEISTAFKAARNSSRPLQRVSSMRCTAFSLPTKSITSPSLASCSPTRSASAS